MMLVLAISYKREKQNKILNCKSNDVALDLHLWKFACLILLFIYFIKGIMTKQELEMFENVKTKNIKYWVPMIWFNNLLSKIRQEGRVYDDMTYNLILQVHKTRFF